MKDPKYCPGCGRSYVHMPDSHCPNCATLLVPLTVRFACENDQPNKFNAMSRAKLVLVKIGLAVFSSLAMQLFCRYVLGWDYKELAAPFVSFVCGTATIALWDYCFLCGTSDE